MMGEEKKLSDIADIISSHADFNIDSDLAEKFVAQFFKAIENGLVTAYCVNINGLGIFRVLKSVPADRVLFLDKFKRNEVKTESKTINVPEIKPRDTSTVLDKAEIENKPENDTTTHLLNEDTTPSHTEEETETVVGSDTFSHEKEAPEPTFVSIDDEADGNEPDDFLYEYEIQDKLQRKRKRLSRIKIAALLTTVIVGIGILILLFLYPKNEKSINLVQPVKAPQYTEIENEDTINFSHTLMVESDLDFFTLSQIYYKSDKFWPYIYKANQENVVNNNPFVIKTGSIIRIPKLEERLIDKDNMHSLDSANTLINEILRLRTNTFSGN